jgi:hypothetical protein
MNALKRDGLLVAIGLVVLLAAVGLVVILSLFSPPASSQDAATAPPFLCLEGYTPQGAPDGQPVCVRKETVEERLDRIEQKLDQALHRDYLTH